MLAMSIPVKQELVKAAGQVTSLDSALRESRLRKPVHYVRRDRYWLTLAVFQLELLAHHLPNVSKAVFPA